MQYIITQNGKNLPIFNTRKIVGRDNLPVSLILSFRATEIQTAGYTEETLKDLMLNQGETAELTMYNESNVMLNQYYKYSKLDEVSCKYNYLISPYVPATEAQAEVTDEEGNVLVPAIEATEEIPEVRDTLIVVTLLKQNELEAKIDDTTKTVDAMAVAMAEMMGV